MRPGSLEKLFLANQLALLFRQSQQDIHGPAAEVQFFSPAVQLAMLHVKPKGPEIDDLVGFW